MYCVRCGAELSDHEKKCPLCGTKVINPDFADTDAPAPYPEDKIVYREFNRHGILFILTSLFFIAAALTLICDLSRNHTIIWSGYSSGALVLGYLIIVFPLWFKDCEPVIFAGVDFAGALFYLGYINYATDGSWFLKFALPVTLIFAVIICAFIELVKYFRKKILFIFGGMLLSLGIALVGIELLINYSFRPSDTLVWSIYPLTVFAVLGIMLIIIAACPKLQLYLERKFFV